MHIDPGSCDQVHWERKLRFTRLEVMKNDCPRKKIRCAVSLKYSCIPFKEENIKFASSAAEVLQKLFNNIYVMKKLTPMEPIK
mmetsp:Transcript_99583/g.160550  ORF Transcript_99583/g.160550 Transcript_99583/m.160550 type:complete len:83 (+) Transcript_99583:1243-1491(+)